MAKVKTISDRLAKRKCAEWLGQNGFEKIRLAKNESCDLLATKGSKSYFIEIKYSSKEKGIFFGTVMLTELFQAINNRNNYLFLVCRGNGENIKNWFFKLVKVEDFIKCCTLTTPIFLYHLYPDRNGNLSIPKFRENTILASEELIREMWKDFNRWKSGSHLSNLEK
jgi:Holliday junction resolvase